MPQTRQNGIQVWINSDAYNLAADGATLADTSNVVIPVANQTGRDALTLHTGLAVTRNDVPGQPIEIYNGSSWDRLGSRAHAATQIVGSGMTANDYLTGTKRVWEQFGSTVATTDASGNLSINYPVTFANGVVTAILTNGDSNTGNLQMALAGAFTQTTSTLFVNVKTAHTGAVVASASVRVNWIVKGW